MNARWTPAALLVAGALTGPMTPVARADAYAPTARSATVARIVVATVARSAPERGAGARATLRTQAEWAGGAMRLLVLGSRTDAGGNLWLRVLLPDRPGDRGGWVDADVVRLAATPWRVRVDVAARRLTLVRAGRIVWSTRVVVGRPGLPTPRGRFAVYERVRLSPGASVGPWALHLTAHSRVLHSYDGGPGRIALHGRAGALLADPLGSARSHGCVRMDNAEIRRLALHAGPGTPVTIR